MDLTLTPTELAFLTAMKLTAADVFDARGMSRADRRAAAKAAGCRIIVGNKACDDGGHRLRWRPGHCAPCNPAGFAYNGRYDTPGFVYIAGSPSTGLLKIGVTDDIDQRAETLNYKQAYGGLRDWEVLCRLKVAEKGKVEHDALALLNHCKEPRSYFKNGKQQVATELLRAPFESVVNAINTAVGAGRFTDLHFSPRWKAYETAVPAA
jgi:T5orf172 domain